MVRIPNYPLHRDPRNFYPHPESWWPDRWLADPFQDDTALSEPDAFKLNKDAFVPFSRGPMN